MGKYEVQQAKIHASPAVLIYEPPPVYARPTDKAKKNEGVMMIRLIK